MREVGNLHSLVNWPFEIPIQCVSQNFEFNREIRPLKQSLWEPNLVQLNYRNIESTRDSVAARRERINGSSNWMNRSSQHYHYEKRLCVFYTAIY